MMAGSKRKPAWTDLLGTKPDASAEHGNSEDEQPPVTVLMHTIVGNAENPRPELDYSEDDPEFAELKSSMREIGQLQPLAVVSRGVYEQAKPEATEQLSPKSLKALRQAEWVVVTGNRRLAAARQLGWTRIDVRVHNQLGDEDGRIDDAVIIENIHRKNIAPIKEATFLKRMVERHGSQDKVAERIGKSQMYVSHRLALLKLAPDLQKQVETGELKIKDARQLASQAADHDKQRAQAAELKKKAAEPRPRRAGSRTSRRQPVPAPPVSNPAPSLSDGQNPVLGSGRQGVPVPRTQGTEGAPQGTPGGLAYDDPSSIAAHLVERLSEAALFEVAQLLLREAHDRAPERYRELVADPTVARAT